MSLGRSITRKASKYGFRSSDSSADYSRRNSVSKTQISAPVALISTTNMISYTSPSLRTSLRTSLSQGSISSSNSIGSPSSDCPSSPLSVGSSGEDSAPESPATNNLSPFFSAVPAAIPAPVRSNSTRSVKKGTRPTSELARSPSLPPFKSPARKSGFQPVAAPPKSAVRGLSTQHPFGAELAQVAEMAEEIAGLEMQDAEEQFMRERGLLKFNASDYEQEIWDGMGGVFEDELLPVFGKWI